MLVLSRQRSECVRIDDEIQIKVLEINGDSISLGITAPDKLLITSSTRFSKMRNKQRNARR